VSVGLREKGKARRRSEVLAAASTLWRMHGVANVTLAHIAETAEVSAQTVYNLIGGVEEVKVAIVDELLERLEHSVGTASERGVDLSVRRALTSARLFAEDPDLYRQILVGIPQAVFDGARLSQDGSVFQRAALLEAQRLGQLRPDIDIDAVSWQIHVQYLGGLFSWASGSLDDAAFVRATEVGVLALLSACASEAVRADLQGRLTRLLAVSDCLQSRVNDR